jgi:hypothetical protein
MNGLNTTLTQYRITATHDAGRIELLLMAASTDAAIASFMDVEGCSRRAITKVEFYQGGEWWPANILYGDKWAHEEKARKFAELLAAGNHRTVVRRDILTASENPAYLALSIVRHLAAIDRPGYMAKGRDLLDAVMDVQSLLTPPNH